ncbi:distal tail protein Dit [Virgibacillus salexigens]|uniref:distal tail protein Dit n=1 Tax=Virgibacillus salexigens TaxID=61016 RepID=UPI00190C4958|nr:distal tail protein Dit [Virgibacillus salexigens]
MYDFVDLHERGTRSTSLSIQTLFHGMNLDDVLTDENGSFVTLTVQGRGNLKQRITTTEVPGGHGVLEYNDPTFDIREIKVKYKIADRTNAGLRQRINRLNALLVGSKKTLVFTDEEATFYATLLTNDAPEETSNELVCTLTFLCSDPFKYGKHNQIIALKKFTWEEYAGQTWEGLING